MKVYHPKPLNQWRINLVERRSGGYYASIDAPNGVQAEGETLCAALDALSVAVKEAGFGA